jgi:hypothetical protein
MKSFPFSVLFIRKLNYDTLNGIIIKVKFNLWFLNVKQSKFIPIYFFGLSGRGLWAKGFLCATDEKFQAHQLMVKMYRKLFVREYNMMITRYS